MTSRTKPSIFRWPSKKPSVSFPLKLPKVEKASLGIRPLKFPPVQMRFMHPGELEVLCHLMKSVANNQPTSIRVVEIGVNEGRTARCMLDNISNITHYIGVDVKPGYRPNLSYQLREMPRNPGYLAALNTSFKLMLLETGSRELKGEDIGDIDIMFIDGDHSPGGVLGDTMLAYECVRSGGMIIWHDYHGLPNIGVREVLENFSSQGHDIFHVDGTWLAYEPIP